jgi:hypothetical protein
MDKYKFIEFINTNLTFEKYLEKEPLLMNHLISNKTNFLIKEKYIDYRAYKDESTNIFNEVFFSDKTTIFRFLYYCYQQINYDIISNINDKLNKYDTVLQSNEEILLISKGGNMMSLFINKILNVLNKGNSNQIKEKTKISGISDTDLTIYLLTENELRFNLIYSIITPLLYESLKKIRSYFDNIMNSNNYIVNHNKINNNTFTTINRNDKKYSIEYISKKYKEIYDIIQKINKNIKDLQDLQDIVYKLIFDKDNYVIFDDIHIGSKYINILQCIKYYYNLKKNIRFNKNNFNDIIGIIINEQRKIIEINLSKILGELKDFYQKDKINNFLEKLSNTFNTNYIDKKYYKYTNFYTLPINEYILTGNTNFEKNSLKNNNFENKFLQYNHFVKNSLQNNSELNKNNNNKNLRNNNKKLINNNKNLSKIQINFEYNDVEYIKENENNIIRLLERKDFIIKNIQSIYFNGYLESKTKNNHYISINSTINNRVYNHIVNFDLFRIKLNIELPNIIINNYKGIDQNKNLIFENNNELKTISIPSEFLDVSIPKFNDINLIKFRNNFKFEDFNKYFSILNFQKNNINYLNIITYNLEYLIDDLNMVLYKQNTFIPWIDMKYEKRLNRLCCLSLLLIIKKNIGNKNIQTHIDNLIENLENLKDLFQIYPINKNTIDKIKKNIENNIKNKNDCLFTKEIVSNFLYSDEYFKYYNINNDIENIFNLSFEFIYNIINIEINTDKNNNLYNFLNYKLESYNYKFIDDNEKNKYIINTYKTEFIKFLKEYIHWLKYWKTILYKNENIFRSININKINITL